MDYLKIAKNIVEEVDAKVKRIYWTNEEIDKWFGRRSAEEIIKNGTTCFMNPCSDLTLVSAALMFENNIPYNFIIEEHLPTKDFNFDKSKLVVRDFDFRLHLKIEYENEEGKQSIDFKRENEVYILKEKYNEDISNFKIIKIPGEKINPSMPLYKTLGYDSLEKLIKDKFNGYSLNTHLERLKQDNSKENYLAYAKRNGEDFKIITAL